MKCWKCETKEVKVIVIADDGYYEDKGVCGDDACVDSAEMAQQSWTTIMELGEYLAKYPNGLEYLEHA